MSWPAPAEALFLLSGRLRAETEEGTSPSWVFRCSVAAWSSTASQPQANRTQAQSCRWWLGHQQPQASMPVSAGPDSGADPMASVSKAGRGDHAHGDGPCQAPAEGGPLRHTFSRQGGHLHSSPSPSQWLFPKRHGLQRVMFVRLKKQVSVPGAGCVRHSRAPEDPQGQFQEPSRYLLLSAFSGQEEESCV